MLATNIGQKRKAKFNGKYSDKNCNGVALKTCPNFIQ